jgi:hypothetical protein
MRKAYIVYLKHTYFMYFMYLKSVHVESVGDKDKKTVRQSSLTVQRNFQIFIRYQNALDFVSTAE